MQGEAAFHASIGLTPKLAALIDPNRSAAVSP